LKSIPLFGNKVYEKYLSKNNMVDLSDSDSLHSAVKGAKGVASIRHAPKIGIPLSSELKAFGKGANIAGWVGTGIEFGVAGFSADSKVQTAIEKSNMFKNKDFNFILENAPKIEFKVSELFEAGEIQMNKQGKLSDESHLFRNIMNKTQWDYNNYMNWKSGQDD